MEFIVFIVVTVVTVLPLWRILPRAGIAAPWALVAIVPFGVLVLLWVLAYRRWPGDDPAMHG